MSSNYPDDEGRDYQKELTREDVLRTKTWITQDGRHLHVSEITDDHLQNIFRFCEGNLTRAEREKNSIIAMQDYKENPVYLIEAEQDVVYWAKWMRIIGTEIRRRRLECEHGTPGCPGKGEKHWCKT